MCRIEELCYFAAIFLKRNNVLLVESTMVRTPNKELDVALELFNSELKKLKSLEKEQAVIKKAERKKADAVKALQEAEKNPDLYYEEKAQAKATWLKADDDLKRILAGEDPLPEEVAAESPEPDVQEENSETEEAQEGPSEASESDVLDEKIEEPAEESQNLEGENLSEESVQETEEETEEVAE